MNNTLVFAVVIALVAVFALASPFDVATAQSNDAVPDSDDSYKDGEHEGKSCPNKERKSSVEQSS